MPEEQPNLRLQNDERYRLLAETMLQGVVHQDVTGRVIAMNPAAERIIGLSRDELLHAVSTQKTRDTIREDGSPMPRGEHPTQLALKTGKPVHGVVMGIFNYKENDYRWIRVDAMPVFRPGETQPAEVYAVLEDFTERRRTEQALEESRQQNEFLAEIIRASSQAMAIGYPDGRLGLVNKAFEELTGYSSQELQTIDWAVALTPARWRDFEARQLIEQLRTGLPIRYEKEYIRKDGTLVPVELLVHLVRGADGNPIYYYSFLTDITERKHKEQELRDSEERMRLATEATGVGIWEWDVRTNRIRWDAQMFRIYGITPTADGFVEYHTWSSAVLPEDLAMQEHQLQETVRKRGHGSREFRLVRGDTGECRHISAVETVRVDPDGNARCVVGTNLDITDRKQKEQELKDLVQLADGRAGELAIAKATAEAANTAKDHFLAVLSHELRTPLTPVLATTMMLEADDRLSADHLAMVQMMRRNVELEARLIDDLLDITRISRNKLELKITVLDAHKKIANVLGICAEDAAAKSQSVRTELVATEHQINGDPARFQQIVWNLLKNAIKFTPVGGDILIRTHNPQQGRLVIVVTDNGVGIDSQAFPRIFEAFEQGGREVTRRFGGLGLGLAISRALVEMHNGTIRAESDGPGRGATFTVEVPTSGKLMADLKPVQTNPVPIAPCRILLVEDHVDTRRVMTRLLSSMSCHVQAAGTVAEALALAEQHKFDLVISDIGLPDAAGTDLMRQLRDRYGLIGIALSGYGMDEDLQRSKAAGFAMHLTKPINIQELQEAVRKLTSPISAV